MTSDKNPPDDDIKPLRADDAAPNHNLDGNEVCSFCGKGPSQINAMVSKGSVRICDLCVNAARAGLSD